MWLWEREERLVGGWGDKKSMAGLGWARCYILYLGMDGNSGDQVGETLIPEGGWDGKWSGGWWL